jgi:predicted extracellular nuclease
VGLDHEPGHGRLQCAVSPTERRVLISEYVEGSSNNKAVEIYNGNSNALN